MSEPCLIQSVNKSSKLVEERFCPTDHLDVFKLAKI